MHVKHRYSGASVVPLFPDRAQNGGAANQQPFSREEVLGYCRYAQLRAEACGSFSAALRLVRLQARAGCARPRILRDLRRLQLKAEACRQWSAALTAIELQWRFGRRREATAAAATTAVADAPRLAA